MHLNTLLCMLHRKSIKFKDEIEYSLPGIHMKFMKISKKRKKRVKLIIMRTHCNLGKIKLYSFTHYYMQFHSLTWFQIHKHIEKKKLMHWHTRVLGKNNNNNVEWSTWITRNYEFTVLRVKMFDLNLLLLMRSICI